MLKIIIAWLVLLASWWLFASPLVLGSLPWPKAIISSVIVVLSISLVHLSYMLREVMGIREQL